MAFKEFAFQNTAVKTLLDTFAQGQKNAILQAPTGSGKTVILIKLMDRIIEDTRKKIAFVWLTPGAGELEEQSWRKTSENALYVRPQFLMDALMGGFNSESVTFLNWEIVNRKGNIALRDGEIINLPQAINHAKDNGIEFILIVDEEHRNQTLKAQEIIDLFDAKMIIRASATPIEDENSKLINISEDDVIAEHLISREVYINDHLIGAGSATDLQGDDQGFLDAADEKRLAIKSAYLKLNRQINPLVLIQFPDEKKADDEIQTKVELTKSYLIDELGQKEEQIAVWMSNQHINIAQIERNDSPVNYLLMKQAVATGWDAPRAKVLVTLRLNMNARFALQTIGRIRRMPEQIHYESELLDNSFVYSNDEQYVSDVIKEHLGSGLAQFSLKSDVKKEQFNLQSLRLSEKSRRDLNYITHAYHDQFKKEFGVGKNVLQNYEILKKHGFIFGTSILSEVPAGSVSKLADMVDLDTVKVEIPIVETNAWGFRYDAVMNAMMPYLHIGDDIKDARAMTMDMFGTGETGSGIDSVLKLRPKERYSFVINNAKKLRDIAKNMDVQQDLNYQEDLFSFDSKGKYKHVDILLKSKEGYLVNKDSGINLLKNVYEGYSTNNFVKQSRPERLLERALEHIKPVKWVFRSKDHGADYFSIPYLSNTRDFYPDYLIQDLNGTTYIIETKGAQGENIDPYAKQKFEALRAYVSGKWGGKEKFAFVREDKKQNILKYNNTQWSEDVEDDSTNWKPLDELFQ
ncbi:DEAD/DEAH box helicase [Oenococcus oeni]|uniref:DEAD/DEAH box helicase n=1 Tax=Oenococcus oeni TaxID=1247 RepID=UPI0010B06E45|nr:DEAD/DEAH box helicase family protein [Oenococcus oeni]SYW16683.1 Dna or rna helicases of superfamily ii-like protein [Oenococcus oeni]